MQLLFHMMKSWLFAQNLSLFKLMEDFEKKQCIITFNSSLDLNMKKYFAASRYICENNAVLW